jgi:hypothetical protein
VTWFYKADFDHRRSRREMDEPHVRRPDTLALLRLLQGGRTDLEPSACGRKVSQTATSPQEGGRPMLIVVMPRTFRPGDTQEVCIHGQRKRVTWRDARTLVIEPGDARLIHEVQEAGPDTIRFVCGNKRSALPL